MKRIVVRHVHRRKARHNFFMILASGFMIGFVLGIAIFSKLPYRLAKLTSFSTLDKLPGLHSNLTLAVDDRVAKELEKHVRIFCFVTTSPEKHVHTAWHVKETWAKRCNALMFGSRENFSLPSIALRGRNGWENTKEVLRYVNENHLNSSDWVLAADDDTYVVLENLRHFLSAYNPSEPIYFGSRPRKDYKNEGAYVFSKAAVRKFVAKVDSTAGLKLCEEGSNFNLCLAWLKIRKMDSRDSLGRGRFFLFDPEQQLIPREWKSYFLFWNYEYKPPPEGLAGCSDSAVAFHNVDPRHMYVMEYLLYNVWPYGIKQHFPASNYQQTTK